MAGHPPVFVRRADGSVEAIEERGDVLGVFPDAIWNRRTFALEPGDTVVLYTDGVTEAGSRGVRLGEDGLEAVLRDTSSEDSVESLVTRIRQLTHAFAGRELADDAAVLVLRRRADAHRRAHGSFSARGHGGVRTPDVAPVFAPGRAFLLRATG